MSIPDYQSLMRPCLVALSDGRVWSAPDLRDAVGQSEGITADERDERHASGTGVFSGRVHWAITYLAAAGAVTRVGRGRVQITTRGEELLASGPPRITQHDLMQFDEFQQFIERARAGSKRDRYGQSSQTDASTALADPQEQIDEAVKEINAAVANELVERIKLQSPKFLEQIVLDLMVAMGYGTTAGLVEHIGGSGDEGFDGVVHQDALGLERVFLQAKRYNDKGVGRPELQAFAGALQGAGATRGVFITTSRFTSDAREFVDRIPARVVLIDGDELGRLLVKHGVGVQSKRHYNVVEVDDDVFE